MTDRREIWRTKLFLRVGMTCLAGAFISGVLGLIILLTGQPHLKLVAWLGGIMAVLGYVSERLGLKGFNSGRAKDSPPV